MHAFDSFAAIFYFISQMNPIMNFDYFLFGIYRVCYLAFVTTIPNQNDLF